MKILKTFAFVATVAFCGHEASAAVSNPVPSLGLGPVMQKNMPLMGERAAVKGDTCLFSKADFEKLHPKYQRLIAKIVHSIEMKNAGKANHMLGGNPKTWGSALNKSGAMLGGDKSTWAPASKAVGPNIDIKLPIGIPTFKMPASVTSQAKTAPISMLKPVPKTSQILGADKASMGPVASSTMALPMPMMPVK